MNGTTLKELFEALTERFPKAWFKEGGDFANGYETSIWTGEGSYIGDEEMFDYYAMGNKYEFGAHITLRNFVEKRGYYVECYDAGTYFIYPQ
jgi:hypothetical protein